ncbi:MULTISPECIES: prenyltransferase/squalene oxidase repeat-containing protein [Streptomycetaceae]|uniref:Secreted protein n=1 Tax=Streptantibioticus cattleyicolor (strain ATCC 35852 / DSM 46488 / JCM 4925 / NBRC 14057 / NRRL 8057) TaxID=1003195 RepID=F8K378_STREN|nr:MULTISPECIES: prenyltransferase/squalene oxidase repeat-containing protein [Streptomycetaceae]AEW93793.1 secreted protein [Streptantibioticus cattleyicolor NRRL 8057 = DSM 46488]MYS58479.1 hypothetical protein [Streptomyces sp. SID5468]CCB74139.1 conserved exported protein of unknown function [Streptantibioticus cattleyicolor NRRL 8057 = DSM 46488]
MAVPFAVTTRRVAAALATAVLGMATAANATAAPGLSAAPRKPPAALYGSADPTYDGVWRQSTALLALHAAGVTPAREAVAWLAGQQCADGGFAAYRADTGKPCDAKTEDVNSTALAVQALTALGGHQDTVHRATGYLTSIRHADHGWGFQPKAPTDANSTAVVIGALAAAGAPDPRAVTALRAFQIDCDTKGAQAADRGAFAYQPAPSGALAANDKATADAAFALLGKGYLLTAPATDRAPKPFSCPGGHGDASAAADAASAYLTDKLTKGGGHLTAAQPGSDQRTPDYGTTADAVLALAAGGHLTAARTTYDWLAKNATSWAKGNPAALGSLVLAAGAVGSSPHDAHGTDLVRELTALGPRPAAATPSAAPEQASAKSGGVPVWWFVGAGLAAGAGIGWVLSFRNRKRR